MLFFALQEKIFRKGEKSKLVSNQKFNKQQRKSSKRRALQFVCICSTIIKIFFELIPSTNRGGLFAELYRFQSIQPRAGIALTFWNLEHRLSKTILVLYYIPKLKYTTFNCKNISLIMD